MRKDVHIPGTSHDIGDVLNDLEKCDATITKYFKCGGRLCQKAPRY